MAEHPKINVATFKFCNCSFSDQTHLLVAYKVVDLTYGNAVAISYTWGEFDRREVTLGHDENGDDVKLCLGMEWPLNDVVQGLARICREHARGKGCWMDQLCIPQESFEGRRNLIMQIPNIYRTLRTVILLCGSPCTCFKRIAALSLVRDRTGLKILNPIVSRILEMQKHLCWDTFGISSYFQRLWTRQEFRYSCEISVVWCSSMTRKCAQPESDLRSMSLYAQQIFQHSRYGAVSLQRSSNEFIMGCYTSIKGWPTILDRYDLEQGAGLWWLVYSFLGGRSLNRRAQSLSMSEESEATLFIRFMIDLVDISNAPVHRSASEACDYVAAVWVDCPRYELPVDYKSLKLSYLLENAIKQLEKNFHLSLAVSFPSDLSTLSINVAPGLWRPTTYIGEIDIRSSGDVYGPILPSQPLILDKRGMPKMHVFGIENTLDSTTNIGSTTEQYPQLKGPENARIMIRELHSISAYWPLRLRMDIRFRSEHASEQALVDTFSADRERGASYTTLLLLMYLLTAQKLDEDDIKESSSILQENFDCYSFAFGYVCLALGIDAVVARRRHLSLVATRNMPKQIGLKVNRRIDGAPPIDESMSTPPRKQTMHFHGTVDDNLRQLCDVKQLESEESGIEFEIDIVWVPIISTAGQM